MQTPRLPLLVAFWGALLHHDLCRVCFWRCRWWSYGSYVRLHGHSLHPCGILRSCDLVVSSAATCGALVIVGFLMMTDVVDIDWTDLLEGFPAFMVIAGIPLTYSISNGIGMGFIAYVIVALVTGRGKKG